jgi:hypothetical protein
VRVEVVVVWMVWGGGAEEPLLLFEEVGVGRCGAPGCKGLDGGLFVQGAGVVFVSSQWGRGQGGGRAQRGRGSREGGACGGGCP